MKPVSPFAMLAPLAPMLVLSACALPSSSSLAPTPSPASLPPPITSSEIAGSLPIDTGSGPREELHGVWHSPANGWFLDVDANGIRRWEAGRAGCYRVAPGGEDAATMGSMEYRYAALSPDGRHAILQYIPGDTPTPFERVDRLPDSCGSTDLTGESAVFEVFAATMEDHYAFFERRGVDWQALVDAARPRISDGMGNAALFSVLGDMIEQLGDSHTKLIASFDGERHRAQGGLGHTLPMVRSSIGEGEWLGGIVEILMKDVLDPGSAMAANGRIVWGTIDDGRIGYLQVFTMGGFDESVEPGTPEWGAAEQRAFATAMDRILPEFAQAEAVIVDLSNNRGGYDVIARQLAARFAARPFLAYSVATHQLDRPPVPYRIEPAEGARFTGPVYLLTSDVTVSGGELATLAFRQLPNVTHAGGTTRGSFSTPLAKPLPNGWYLELSSESFLAPDGTLYEGRGIAPQWPLEVFPDSTPTAGHAAALRMLVDRISTGTEHGKQP